MRKIVVGSPGMTKPTAPITTFKQPNATKRALTARRAVDAFLGFTSNGRLADFGSSGAIKPKTYLVSESPENSLNNLYHWSAPWNPTTEAN